SLTHTTQAMTTTASRDDLALPRPGHPPQPTRTLPDGAPSQCAAPSERDAPRAGAFSSKWRKRQIGVKLSEKAPFMMRTYSGQINEAYMLDLSLLGSLTFGCSP